MIKLMVGAGLIALNTMGVAAAAAEMPVGAAVLTGGYDAARDRADLNQAAWVGRYGQLCFHGPVWEPACHASNLPGPYIPGHWTPIRARGIAGHYA